MKTHYTSRWKILICLIFFLSATPAKIYASHAQGGDLTYTCLGGNQYRIRLAFYRDCSGTNAPGSATITISSISCNQNYTVTLNPINGTGQDVTPICPQLTTVCAGGNNPGVQEYIYEGITTLPMACTDWTFGFTLCCRNAAINTINNPGGENIYIQSQLNNVAAPCNSSPSFSNIPVPFVCSGQSYCFNHGAIDPEGDSLSYTLVTPQTSPQTTVTYIAPYSASQPLQSNPAVTFNPQTGDICMNPTQIIVTVMAVRVEEWRNGVMIGSVVRDIQLRTISCNNTLPYITGINNTNTYATTVCVGTTLSFTISSFDADAAQNVTMTWNNAIPSASFTTSGGQTPTGTFTWTPGVNAVSNTPYCFTVTVSDDACPFNGSQTFAFCITVSGFALNITSTGTNCGSPNGTASVTVSGGTGPFSYSWSPTGGNSASASGLAAGNYTVTVSENNGCVSTSSVAVTQGQASGTIQSSINNISCYGGNNGSASVSVTGGQQPYTYAWSNAATTASINNLTAGSYSLTVTTANGCQSTATVIITQPASVLAAATNINSHVNCNNASNGVATANASGGTSPYLFSWNSTPAQNTATANGLGAGTYTVVVTDDNGCTASGAVTITQPPALLTSSTINPVTCNGGSNGSAQVNVSGGVTPYSFAWNTSPAQFTAGVTNLPAGNYNCTITDANGCGAGVSVTISQPQALTASVPGYNNVSCYGGSNGSAALNVSGGTSPYSYYWNTSPAQTTSSAVNLPAGNFTATVTDANGCATVSTVGITEPLPVTISVSPGDTVCPGQAVTISANSNGGTGNHTYNWSPNVGSANSYTVYPNSLTTYQVHASDANGCNSSTASIIIDVFQFNAGNLSVSGNTSICEGASTTIGATVSGNTGTITWSWQNQIWNSGGPFTVTPAVTTIYEVTATNGCAVAVTNSITVTVNPIPQASIPSQSITGCGGIPVTFSDSNTNNSNCTYSWDFGDNTTGVGNNVTHIYHTSGIFTITLTILSPHGCAGSATTTANIVMYELPGASFVCSGNVVSELVPTVIFTNQCSPNTIGWDWDFGDNSTSTTQNPSHTYTDTGHFQVRLVATSYGGCTDTFELPVYIQPEFAIYIPNAFTPNGDGNNDIFLAYGNAITAFHMDIFDRWGNLIFTSDDVQEGWPGIANDGSEKAQQDVYVYKMRIKDHNGQTHNRTGSVSLIK